MQARTARNCRKWPSGSMTPSERLDALRLALMDAALRDDAEERDRLSALLAKAEVRLSRRV